MKKLIDDLFIWLLVLSAADRKKNLEGNKNNI